MSTKSKNSCPLQTQHLAKDWLMQKQVFHSKLRINQLQQDCALGPGGRSFAAWNVVPKGRRTGMVWTLNHAWWKEKAKPSKQHILIRNLMLLVGVADNLNRPYDFHATFLWQLGPIDGVSQKDKRIIFTQLSVLKILQKTCSQILHLCSWTPLFQTNSALHHFILNHNYCLWNVGLGRIKHISSFLCNYPEILIPFSRLLYPPKKLQNAMKIREQFQISFTLIV